MRLSLLALLARTLLLTVGAFAALPACSSERCRSVSGPFTSVVIPPPACESAANLCTHGTLTGDLEAVYDFTANTQSMADDPGHPGRSNYTGTSLITSSTGDGTLLGEDTGFLDPDGKGSADFETTVVVVGGTDRWEGASGRLVAVGVLDFMTGDAAGSYSGTLCEAD